MSNKRTVLKQVNKDHFVIWLVSYIWRQLEIHNEVFIFYDLVVKCVKDWVLDPQEPWHNSSILSIINGTNIWHSLYLFFSLSVWLVRWNTGQCVTHQTAGNDPLPLTLDQRGLVQLSQITHQLQTSPLCAATVDPDRNIKCKVKYSDLVNVCSLHIHWQVNISPVCGFLHPSSCGGLKARPKHLFYKYSFQKNVTCLFADKQIMLLNRLEVSSQCEMTVSYIQLSEQERVTCWSVYRYTQGRGCGCQLAVSPEWRFPLRCQEEALEGLLCSPCTKSYGDPSPSLPPPTWDSSPCLAGL